MILIFEHLTGRRWMGPCTTFIASDFSGPHQLKVSVTGKLDNITNKMTATTIYDPF